MSSIAYPWRVGSIQDMRCITDADQKRDAISAMIQGAPHFLEIWWEYFALLKAEGHNEIPIEVYRLALQSAGLDPRSTRLWSEAIECESKSPESGSSLMLQSALSVPLSDVRSLWMRWVGLVDSDQHEILRSIMESSCSVLSSEAPWPDSMTIVDLATPIETLVCLKEQWASLLQSMFSTLQTGGINAELQRRRIDFAFRLLTSQFHFDDGCWHQYALFLVVQMGDLAGAREVALRGVAACGASSVALAALLCKLGDSAPLEHISACSSDYQRLVEQRASSLNLPSSKKTFRAIGKLAESQRVNDWRIYHQWAHIEASGLEDLSMATKVLERGLACTAQNPDSYDQLARSTEHFFLTCHAEGELLNTAEKRVDAANRLQNRGLTASAWNRMLEYEKKLGLLWTGKMESRAATATLDRNSWYIQQALRSRVGHLSTFTQSEVDFAYFVKDLADVTTDPVADLLDYRSDKRRRLENPAASTSEKMPAQPLGWSKFEAIANPAHATPTGADDEVCGPRVLRGTLVHKLSRDEWVEARISREEAHRHGVRSRNANTKGPQSAASLPRQLGNLATLVEQSTSDMSAQHIALLRRCSVRWLLSFLSNDLELGVAFKKHEANNRR